MFRKSAGILIRTGLVCALPAAAEAQTSLDRVDPALIEEDSRAETAEQPERDDAPVAMQQGGSGSAITQSVQVGAILIEGTTELPPSHFARVIEPFAGRRLDAAELEALSTKVAEHARASGYGLATAWIPQQKISNGILRVMVDEGRIDAVEVSGDAAGPVKRMLQALADGRPVRTAALERQLLLAEDIAGVEVGKARLERDARGNVLKISTARDRVEARAYADNWGTETVGPIRSRFYADVNGIAHGADQLSLSAMVTPFEPAEFGLIGAGYETAIGTAGTRITLSGYIATTHPGGVLDDRDIDGRSVEGELSFSQPLVRLREKSLWLDGSFRVSEVRQSRDDVRAREDQLSVLSANFNGFLRGEAWRFRGRADAAQGLDLFGSTDAGDPLASRDDADGRFTKYELWLEYRRDLSKRFSLLLQTEAQLASGPLLSSEEMGLGGRYFLRGYDYREYSGDKGIVASAELRYDFSKLPKPVDYVQLYGFFDGGSVGNYSGGDGGGSLASAGGGVRVWLGDHLDFGLELGVPLKRSDFSDKDPRFSFTVGTRF
jgi:hemolysin activation/secretion protein